MRARDVRLFYISTMESVDCLRVAAGRTGQVKVVQAIEMVGNFKVVLNYPFDMGECWCLLATDRE